MSRKLALVWLVLCCAMLAWAIARAEGDPSFDYDRAARVARLDLEVRQAQAELAATQARVRALRQEIRILGDERACSSRARDLRALRACAGRV